MDGNSKWGVVSVACIAVFIIVLDSSAMNVAIRTLVVDLDTTLSTLQAIIAIYALVIASFLLTGSKLQDIIGRRRSFFTGLMIYASGTIIAALSVNAAMLLLGWSILEGLGAALILPATTTMVSSSYEGRDRVIAFGIWGGIAAMGAALGPIVGGVFTTYLSWRAVFGSELIFIAIILILRHYITYSKPELSWKDFDIIGAVLSVISLSMIVMGILLMNRPRQWVYASAILAVGIILFSVFLLWEVRRIGRGKMPLSDVTLLGNHKFALGNLITVVQQIPLAGFLFIMPVFLQLVLGLNPFMTGVTLLPAAMAVFILSIEGSRISVKIGAKGVLMAGFLISALGAFILGNMVHVGTTVSAIQPGAVLFGSGIGLLLSQTTNLTMSAAPSDMENDASGLLNCCKNLGYSIGTALIGVLLITGIFYGAVDAVKDSGLAPGATEREIEASIISYVDKMQTERPEIRLKGTGDYREIVNASVSSAMRQTFRTLSLILMAGFFISTMVPANRKRRS
ncbi:MFS transporter, partial [Methanothermobacter sp. K4]|uniref:MFS transporter n=1 Tax=Methanothermobacter sp. K4 TaxID=2913262 RepID=UPI001EDB0743